jgi:acyl phosphate:glycerol-3-phosphate acyltransferase
MLEALSIVFGYLLGSLPTAYLLGRWKKGVDIRQLGGGNMGALNAARELGRTAGLIVLLVDAAKGSGAVLIARALGVGQIWIYLAGFAAVIGHCWPVFLKFKGGKGAATTLGICAALAPLPMVYALPLIIIVVLFTSNITLGIAAGIVGLLFLQWILDRPTDLIVFTMVMALFLGLRYVSTGYRTYKKIGSFKDFLIDKDYKPWQTRRK